MLVLLIFCGEIVPVMFGGSLCSPTIEVNWKGTTVSVAHQMSGRNSTSSVRFAQQRIKGHAGGRRRHARLPGSCNGASNESARSDSSSDGEADDVVASGGDLRDNGSFDETLASSDGKRGLPWSDGSARRTKESQAGAGANHRQSAVAVPRQVFRF